MASKIFHTREYTRGVIASKQPNVLPEVGIGDLKLPSSNRLGCEAGVVAACGVRTQSPRGKGTTRLEWEGVIGCYAITTAAETRCDLP